jgi:hypothetical protein
MNAPIFTVTILSSEPPVHGFQMFETTHSTLDSLDQAIEAAKEIHAEKHPDEETEFNVYICEHPNGAKGAMVEACDRGPMSFTGLYKITQWYSISGAV